MCLCLPSPSVAPLCQSGSASEQSMFLILSNLKQSNLKQGVTTSNLGAEIGNACKKSSSPSTLAYSPVEEPT